MVSWLFLLDKEKDGVDLKFQLCSSFDVSEEKLINIGISIVVAVKIFANYVQSENFGEAELPESLILIFTKNHR